MNNELCRNTLSATHTLTLKVQPAVQSGSDQTVANEYSLYTLLWGRLLYMKRHKMTGSG